MTKIKMNIKPIILVVLVTVFSVLAIMPTNMNAAIIRIEAPGFQGQGAFGPTCYCPWTQPTCGCVWFVN